MKMGRSLVGDSGGCLWIGAVGAATSASGFASTDCAQDANFPIVKTLHLSDFCVAYFLAYLRARMYQALCKENFSMW